ncbi:hypothetical protein DPMN_179802 [Dreissena polymorpha]|uniref:Uncharacterized protein n=1 Tax=Dreissena polymorpha TaxID=45954 RepID=A0A9D4EDI0_DREPO|nr:hypothetical protein DPMN_179802 [Dreissena polymorpha]
MSSACMNLRSWTSNSETLRSRAKKENVLDTDEVVKILGMRWNPVKDEMSFAERNIPILDVVTKRAILNTHPRSMTPLVYLAPCPSVQRSYFKNYGKPNMTGIPLYPIIYARPGTS